MLFNSVEFLIFFPITILLFFVFPDKWKNIWLLIASYFFYMCWEPIFILLILYTTMIAYFTSRLMEKSGKKKLIAGIAIGLILLNLLWFKYAEFIIELLNDILGRFLAKPITLGTSIILPVGISFFTFQAISYVIDVYRGDVEIEHNFLLFALFVSFFPQLVAGPIERAKNLLCQFKEKHIFEAERVKEGLLIMLWGYFLKLVIADRIALFVDTVYGGYQNYNGAMLLMANVLFAFQLYCDFAGYSTIAVGSAKIMGFRLIDNFNAPFLASSTAQLWRCWHISLSTWFKEYLYIPLGGNRKGKVRKYLNLMIVFCVSGLWHGANLTFLVWGFLNGLYQVIGELTWGIRQKGKTVLGNQKWVDMVGKLLAVIITFLLFVSTMVFFRAQNMNDALYIVQKIGGGIGGLSKEMLCSAGLSGANFILLAMSIAVLLVSDYYKLKKISIYQIINRQKIGIRWGVYLFAILFIIVFGVYGENTGTFIYFAF